MSSAGPDGPGSERSRGGAASPINLPFCVFPTAAEVSKHGLQEPLPPSADGIPLFTPQNGGTVPQQPDVCAAVQRAGACSGRPGTDDDRRVLYH